ncbi:MAG TPA: ATP-binding protein [Syntrophomonadaceae bacterium]|nr:ATP-binding protein [Syntrophomonadaceae bacterium]
MFRKLKFKLALINMAVVGLIFLFFIGVVYFLTLRGVDQQSIQMMETMANQVNAGQPQQVNELRRHRPNFFFVITNPDGEILGNSPNPPLVMETLKTLIRESLHSTLSNGFIVIENESFRFQKAHAQPNGNTVLVFASNEASEEVLHHLLGALTLAGIVALVLVSAGGLFMANRALVPVRNSWQRQKDFVADASHEMRTPLAVIQTNLDLVMGNQDKTVESQADWLNNIDAETRRMTNLVNDLLFLARVDSDQETIYMEVFPLHAAIQEAIRPLEPLAASNRINLQLNISPEIAFYGDETRIKQLVVILIDNAIKYTPADGIVTMELKELERQVEISVSDTGEGIDQENLDKIFERFYRGDKARSRQGGGTGLGLSIAQWIVTKHRGTIKATSTPGEGSTFRILLPR